MMARLLEYATLTSWLVCSMLVGGCQTDPSPSAVSPDPGVENSASPVEDPADSGSASIPSIKEIEEPRRSIDAGVDCKSRLGRASQLASRCFRLMPDEQACEAFFPLVTDLREAGCVAPDAGISPANSSLE